jgi:hypothetical protein
MTVVASSVFRCVQFPHQGKIVTVDQLDFCTTDARAPATNNVPFLGDHKITYESIGVVLLKDSRLLGTFPTPLPPTTHHIATINIISTTAHQSLESSDPWIVPSSLEFDALCDIVPLSLAETSYVSIRSTSPSSDDQHLLAPDNYSMPSRLSSLLYAINHISPFFFPPMNLLWKCRALTNYLGTITIIDPLFFPLVNKFGEIYTLYSLLMLIFHHLPCLRLSMIWIR